MDVKFIEISEENKRILLDVLGYGVDKEGIILVRETKEPYICPITQEKVYLRNASILPFNSSIVINTSALSISEYLSLLPEEKKCD